jgi:GNAT superfamily N-acetyltransferase
MEKVEMIIRPYTSADEESVLSIWLRSTVEGQDFLPKAFWESKLDDVRTVYLPAAVTFVAEENGRIIGFISLLGTMIGGLFVDTNSQGRGVGTSLVESARVHAAQPLEVEVYEQNERARKFYKKCGFAEHERYLQQETNEILLIMKQIVSPAPVAEPQKKNWKDMVAEGLVEGAVSIALGILSGGD